MITLAWVHAQIASGGIPYAEARERIQPGDLCWLHHEFVPTWKGLQTEAVQMFTGPFAHVCAFDRIRWADGSDRLIAYESVVPHPRAVRVSTTAEVGFFWSAVNVPISPAEREWIWRRLGMEEYAYSKPGAVLAGVKALPEDEADNPRQWCAKFTDLSRRESGLGLGRSYVPTAIAELVHQFAPLQYVSMNHRDI